MQAYILGLVLVCTLFVPSAHAEDFSGVEELHHAINDQYGVNYERIAALLHSGVDPNAVSSAGENALQAAFRRRYDDYPNRKEGDNRALLTLLLKFGAVPPGPEMDPHPLRQILFNLDQLAWDLLELKFVPADLIGWAGWPSEPVAELELANTTLALPAPEGFVERSDDAFAGVRRIAAAVPLDSARTVYFVPEPMKDTPLESLTTVAACIDRRDILSIVHENDNLLYAYSFNDEINGRFFRLTFNNDALTLAASEEPPPWRRHVPVEQGMTHELAIAHSETQDGSPYQLIVIHLYDSEDALEKDGLGKWTGFLAAWNLCIKEANRKD